MSLRTVVKRIAERGIVLGGVADAARRRRRNDILILAYHNIVPDGAQAAGDASLHLSQRTFAHQLDMLQRTHDIVPLSAVLDQSEATAEHPSNAPRSDVRRPRAVITFDDAYRGAITAGVAELRKRRLPATVFVAPAYVGGRSFWWDVLTPPGDDALDATLRETALSDDAGENDRILERARQHAFPTTQLPSNATCASEAELDAALDHAGLSYGSHTWSHPNLAALPLDTLATELAKPREWLARYGDRVVSAISYPYGCANADVWRAAEQAGYAAGFMISGGWVDASASSPYALPRLNVPASVSADGFALRAAGLIAA